MVRSLTDDIAVFRSIRTLITRKDIEKSLRMLKQYCMDENVGLDDVMALESKLSSYHTDREKMLKNGHQSNFFH